MSWHEWEQDEGAYQMGTQGYILFPLRHQACRWMVDKSLLLWSCFLLTFICVLSKQSPRSCEHTVCHVCWCGHHHELETSLEPLRPCYMFVFALFPSKLYFFPFYLHPWWLLLTVTEIQCSPATETLLSVPASSSLAGRTESEAKEGSNSRDRSELVHGIWG